MIRSVDIFLTQSHYFPVPPRLKPVNSPAESRSTRTGYGLSRSSPGCRRKCCDESRQRPGIAPVVAGSAPVKAGSVPAEPRYTVAPPALTVSIPASNPGRATPVSHRSSPVMPRRSPSKCRWHSGRAPVFLCTVALPGL
ncbi:hypothetical protein DPMN_086718 [Dreissena polymorpha]|uniref:Uncharacterized protein n=1 Tax=Dreissena polymorpha TaxID=45954 RepID=A0A9D4KQY5_DREPO|nr:hypothetical protein DPMN_086718 [Dreissena polymorpha]